MIFLNRIEEASPFIKMALKVNLLQEHERLERPTDIVSGQITNLLVKYGFADNNYAITKQDLERILNVL